MTWERRYRLSLAAGNSLILPAGFALVAAIALAQAVRWLDRQADWTLFGYTPDGARAVLSALGGSMLTFLVFVLSATLIVVQLASAQMTPRVIPLLFRLRWVKFTLGLLTFTFTYTLAALGRVENRVPDLHVGAAVLFNLACILAFFVFVQHLASGLRPSTILRLVGDQGGGVIEQVYPHGYDPDRPERSHPERPAGTVQVIEFTGRSGVVMAFSTTGLVRTAHNAGIVVEMIPQVGDYLSQGDPLFRVTSAAGPVPADALRGFVAVGSERTMHQDPRFAFRILVDVANRALSPAINDPTTAVIALDQIHHLLLVLGRRQLDDGQARDGEGRVRLVYGTPSWGDFVVLAVSEIRLFGEASLQVDRRLRVMLEHLIQSLPESRRPVLQEELAMLDSGVKRRFTDEPDRKRAGTGDYQGVGGAGM